MKGIRHYPDDDGRLSLPPGGYGKDPRDGNWYAVTPNGHMGSLAHHDVTEHEDGSITVSPSIRVSDGTGELWHGYLRAGEWREVGNAR